MNVDILYETDFEYALFGLGLSFGQTSGTLFCDFKTNIKDVNKLFELSKKLAYTTGGENKFLRMINVILDINMPLYWYKEFDTYKVGTVAQSESTMHTIMNNQFHMEQFEITNVTDISHLNKTIEHLNKLRYNYIKEISSDVRKQYFYQVIKDLPSSWLQRRIVMLNYSVLQNIIKHRFNHKLNEWRYFCSTLLNNLKLACYLDRDKL